MKLPLRSPCPIRPTLTDTRDGTSACSLCSKRVHHLSSMTEAEGAKLIRRGQTEDICVQYVADSRGHVQFAPGLRAAAAAGMLVFAGAAHADGGGDLVASLDAPTEVNRIHNQLQNIGINPTRVTVGRAAGHQNATAERANAQPEEPPELMVMWEGGI